MRPSATDQRNDKHRVDDDRVRLDEDRLELPGNRIELRDYPHVTSHSLMDETNTSYSFGYSNDLIVTFS